MSLILTVFHFEPVFSIISEEKVHVLFERRVRAVGSSTEILMPQRSFYSLCIEGREREVKVAEALKSDFRKISNPKVRKS